MWVQLKFNTSFVLEILRIANKIRRCYAERHGWSGVGFSLLELPIPQRIIGGLAADRFLILDIWGALLSMLILTLGVSVLSTGAGEHT